MFIGVYNGIDCGLEGAWLVTTIASHANVVPAIRTLYSNKGCF